MMCNASPRRASSIPRQGERSRREHDGRIAADGDDSSHSVTIALCWSWQRQGLGEMFVLELPGGGLQ